MLMPNATTNSISFFLHWVKEASPTVQPAVIMMDRNQAQINTIQQEYPQSQTFLCTWHVLRVMRSHFATNEFQALWDKIKAWVKTDDLAEFYTLWDEISSDPSVLQSVVKYLGAEWLPVCHLWSKAARKNISIFEEGDTNMLIEVYVPFIQCMIR
jgi:MULE transposase domain